MTHRSTFYFYQSARLVKIEWHDLSRSVSISDRLDATSLKIDALHPPPHARSRATAPNHTRNRVRASKRASNQPRGRMSIIPPQYPHQTKTGASFRRWASDPESPVDNRASYQAGTNASSRVNCKALASSLITLHTEATACAHTHFLVKLITTFLVLPPEDTRPHQGPHSMVTAVDGAAPPVPLLVFAEIVCRHMHANALDIPEVGAAPVVPGARLTGQLLDE